MTIAEYGSIFSILIFLVGLIPAVLMGILECRSKYYGLLVTLPVLYILLGKEKLFVFCCFVVYEVVLIAIYYDVKQIYKTNITYYLIFALSFVPIICVKIAVFYPKVPELHLFEIYGISYMCFRIWQLIIEIHDGHILQFNLVDIFYFITFFPTLSSGPIDRYHRFVEDSNRIITREEYLSDYLYYGLKNILTGIVYKFGVASLINFYVLNHISKALTLVSGIEYMYAYTVYLFFDFAGYSCLAIGTGYLLGVRVPENFNMPFLSRNMKEFWERWHMSLSKWFGDFLFSRFVLNAVRGHWVKDQNTAVRIGYMVTMTVMGIWHGLTGYYLVYGIYQGIMLVISDKYIKTKFYRQNFRRPYYNLISRLVCFHIVAFGMLIFSGYLIRV